MLCKPKSGKFLHDMHECAPSAEGIAIDGIQETLGDAFEQLFRLLLVDKQQR